MEAESERLRSQRRFSNRESKPWFPWRSPTDKARSQGHMIQMLGRRSSKARGHVHTLAPDSQAPPIPLYRSKQREHSKTNFWWSRSSHRRQRARPTCSPINLPFRLSTLTPSWSTCCCGSGSSTFTQIEIPDPQAIRHQGIFSMPGKRDSSGIQQTWKASAHKWVQFWPNTPRKSWEELNKKASWCYCSSFWQESFLWSFWSFLAFVPLIINTRWNLNATSWNSKLRKWQLLEHAILRNEKSIVFAYEEFRTSLISLHGHKSYLISWGKNLSRSLAHFQSGALLGAANRTPILLLGRGRHDFQ